MRVTYVAKEKKIKQKKGVKRDFVKRKGTVLERQLSFES